MIKDNIKVPKAGENYRYIGASTVYEVVGVTIGAGTSKGSSVIVYKELGSDGSKLFHRTIDDFNIRMVKV